MFKDPYIGMPIDLNNCRGCDSKDSPNRGKSMERTKMGSSDCDTDYGNVLLCNLPIAMSYVPFQQWKTVYSLEKGLERGTIFPELDLPFKGGMRR